MSSGCIDRLPTSPPITTLPFARTRTAIFMECSAEVLRPSSIEGMWVRDEDDWAGISDPKARRRIQNRRNQRRFRRKRRADPGYPEVEASNPSSLVPAVPASARHVITDLDVESVAVAIRGVSILNLRSERNQTMMDKFESFAYRCYAERASVITLRPLLSQYNFIRALWGNVEVLELSSNQMADDDALSPFSASDPNQVKASTALELRVPLGLRPSELQRTTPHHPWIDLIPIPEMRDNIFRRGLESFDEEDLCHDMRGRAHQDPGVLVWETPWDLSGWEVTESFVRTWGWTIVGCYGLYKSTDKWRAKRGEKLLF